MSDKQNGYSTKNNPMEFTYSVKEQTFALENHFTLATFENNNYPLAIYDDTYSRLSGVMISADGKPATFNIPKHDLPAILDRCDYAFNKLMDQELSGATETKEKSSAYTVRFTSGKLKGKTAAEVLIESSDNKDLLNTHYMFLKKNLAKYPKNQAQMDAIVEASKLLDAGKLNSDDVEKGIIFDIYKPGVRPKVRKIRDDGKSFVYEVKITCNIGLKSFVVEVTNYYAPVIKNDKGMLNVKISQKDPASEVKNVMNFSANEWREIVYDIRMQMRLFENLAAHAAFSEAYKQDKTNRAKK